MSTACSFPVLLSCAVLLVTVQAQDSNSLQAINGTAATTLKVGGEVSAPRPTYSPDPEYSEEARAAGYQGTCVLSLIVGADGKPHDIRVERRLGMQLDEKAIEALRRWRFEPALEDGKPVAVQINVEVSFRLYRNGLKTVVPGEQSEQLREVRCRLQSEVYRVSEGHKPRTCTAPSDQPSHLGPVVMLAELNIEGDVRMPTANRNQIAASIKQRTYSGSPDEVASEVSDRVKAAWLDSGFVNAEAHGDVHVLTSSPASEWIGITVQIDEGLQYQLEGIRFRNNRAFRNAEALRNLFPINDGDVFDRAAVAKGLENLRSVYRELGYVNFTSLPDTLFNEEHQTVSLDIDVDEGKQFYVSRINIIGLDEAGFQDVKKNLVLNPGDVYNERLVDLFLRNHASLLPSDASPEPRFKLELNEKAATVAITYDFRRCNVD